ncbi:histidine kinase dimerization/phosphoacceptor domain -containing protein [Methanolobus sp. ZRKC3]|uniref:histidine kinase dimerization/phosphoacceptor domain -containing protein n=1 Tax=Methanolobus sp. ZRKC3 TaxID=3125786 RepID=UPI00324FAAF6
MKQNEMTIKAKLIMYIVVGVFLVLLVSTAVSTSTVTEQQKEMAYLQSVEMARDYANQFDGDMKANMAIAETLGKSMEMYTTADREEVNNILKNVLEAYPSLTGVYVGYEPDAFDGKDSEYINAPAHDSTGRFIPYWNTIQGHIEVEHLVDYDEQDYYQLPRTTKENVVTEPYFYQGIFMVSFDVPILKDNEAVGVAGVDVSLDYIDDVVGEIKAFDTGYAFVTGNTGILVSHPEYKDRMGTHTLYDFGIPEISTAADNIKEGKGGSVETTDPATGKEVIMFYEPVKTGNYSFVLVVPKEEMFAGVTELRNKLVVISMISICFMGMVSYLIATSITAPIDEIVNNFRNIAQDAVDGNLDTRAQTDVEIDFKEIPIGLNMILDAVIAPIRESIRVTSALSKGELETRNKLELKGEFKHLGDTLDNSAESLNNIIADSNKVLTAIQNNDFSRSVRVHGEGEFKILTDGIEKTRETLSQMIEEREKMEEIRKKEIHHRIKNNLQVISSLLYLSSENFEDQEIIDAFMDSRNRVRSMALIHEELYQSKDMSSIDFSDYTEKLLEYLSKSYGIKSKDIKLVSDIEDIYLNVDTAVPLGMIINELVSNSLKHAFPEIKEGEINVELKVLKDHFFLKIRDNGIGMPSKIDYRNTESLGLQLVVTLVDQIDGTIELNSIDGTEFSIDFEESK